MRLLQLDAVRAIAIGLVIVEHYGGTLGRKQIPIGPGSLGVGLFFCLSGFLITSILLSEINGKDSKSSVWLNFYIRRALRLFPPFWAWIAILTLLKIEPIASSWPWHASYLTNVWVAMGNPINDFWSLSVEEQFYIFWPFVITFVPRKQLMLMVFILTLVFGTVFKVGMQLADVDSNLIQALLFSNLTELGVGSMLGIMCFRDGRSFNFKWFTPEMERKFLIAAIVGFVIAVGGWYLWGTKGAYRYYFNDFVCTWMYVWLIMKASTGFTGVPGLFFNNPVVQYVGKISYGLYLTHNFVPDILEKYAPPMPHLLFGVVSLACSLAITVLSWTYFERPILRLKDTLRLRADARAGVST